VNTSSSEPHDDLNMGQSTNDVYPTTIHVAILLHNDKIVKEAKALAAHFIKKGINTEVSLKWGVLKDRMPFL
jgi:aspartate ammonia-lyase